MDSSLLSAASENRLLAILAVLSFMLLIVVTIGVAYLTAVEWRDRRRRGREAAAIPTPQGTRKVDKRKVDKRK
ncbi:MAG: hypothetical protein WBA76_10125 [Phormidesmis sp.]